MRHFMEIKNGDIVSSSMSSHLFRRVDASELKDGLFRVGVSSLSGRAFVKVGARVVREKELARLQAQQDNRRRVAKTGAPGIGNNSHMADMATSRLQNLRSETDSLIRWLSR